MTVSTSSTLTTTVVTWDYDTDFILATAAMIQKYLYTGRPGITSTCFGDNNCVKTSGFSISCDLTQAAEEEHPHERKRHIVEVVS